MMTNKEMQAYVEERFGPLDRAALRERLVKDVREFFGAEGSGGALISKAMTAFWAQRDFATACVHHAGQPRVGEEVLQTSAFAVIGAIYTALTIADDEAVAAAKAEESGTATEKPAQHHVRETMPCCGQILDNVVTNYYKRREPKAGDFFICCGCGSALRFDEQLHLMTVSDEEMTKHITRPLDLVEVAITRALIAAKKPVKDTEQC